MVAVLGFDEAKHSPRFTPIIPSHKATPFSRCFSVRGLRGWDGVEGEVEDGLGKESTYGSE